MTKVYLHKLNNELILARPIMWREESLEKVEGFTLSVGYSEDGQDLHAVWCRLTDDNHPVITTYIPEQWEFLGEL